MGFNQELGKPLIDLFFHLKINWRWTFRTCVPFPKTPRCIIIVPDLRPPRVGSKGTIGQTPWPFQRAGLALGLASRWIMGFLRKVILVVELAMVIVARWYRRVSLKNKQTKFQVWILGPVNTEGNLVWFRSLALFEFRSVQRNFGYFLPGGVSFWNSPGVSTLFSAIWGWEKFLRRGVSPLG